MFFFVFLFFFFDTKNVILHLNFRTLNMYSLASFGFGFRRSKISRNYIKKSSLHTPKACVGGILIDYTLILRFKVTRFRGDKFKDFFLKVRFSSLNCVR